jgi:hypothetical protein
MRRTGKPSFVVHLLTGFLALSLVSCGGDDCLECTDAETCPAFTKQCQYGTATVQQCSGVVGEKSCCAASAGEVSCRMVAPLDTDVGYRLENGLVRFRMISAKGSHCVAMDPIENGWFSKGMSAAEQQAIIDRRMAEVFAIAATLDDDDVAPRSPTANTPVDPGGGW